MSELSEKVKASIERLRAFEPKSGDGYYLAFSGGKDSVVCKALLDLAGVKYHSVYRVTSVDPPELVRFIKEKHPDVQRAIPHYSNTIQAVELRGKPITMWNLIPMKLMPPTRTVRYCCHALKEDGGAGEMVVTGVRWEESVNRTKNHGTVTISSRTISKEIDDRENFHETKFGGLITNNDNDESRRLVEQCYKHHRTTVNPIIDWTWRDIWDFIHAENIDYCGLYDDGYQRLGCIACPMASTSRRERDFYRWPKYKLSYLRAFEKMLDNRERRGKMRGEMRMGSTPESVFSWWMDYHELNGQMDFFDDLEDDDG